MNLLNKANIHSFLWGFSLWQIPRGTMYSLAAKYFTHLPNSCLQFGTGSRQVALQKATCCSWTWQFLTGKSKQSCKRCQNAFYSWTFQHSRVIIIHMFIAGCNAIHVDVDSWFIVLFLNGLLNVSVVMVFYCLENCLISVFWDDI